MLPRSLCHLNRILAFALVTISSLNASEPKGAEVPDLSAELPRIPRIEAGEALKTFQIAPGFTIEQIASEPLVNSPVAMCFDADGKLYVIEMRDYSEQDKEHLGQVRLLEDLDGDGFYDKSTVFADGLSWPTAIICYDGGVFVGAAPDIYYLKDTTGDGVSDVKKKVFTGFGRSNVQGLLNSFRWGLDCRIHGVTNHCGGVVKSADRPDDAGINLRGRDFSFDPKTLELRAESGGGQHGMSYDDWGRKFTCNNSIYASLILYEDRYVARNPYLVAPAACVQIATDGGQPPVFRTSPVEPWRIARTRMRVQEGHPGAKEGGGQPAGHLTAATGITIVRGDALGDDFRGVAIIGDVGSNLVHRRRLKPDGLKFHAERLDHGTEFISSSDIWFRPVQFENGPDGCLHILDMYREVIEHPWSLPEVIKKHLDLTSGRDCGRLYRVYRTGETIRRKQNLSELSSDELVSLLAHKNAWHRETASRLLYERQDRSMIPALQKLALTGESPLGRLHAIWMLAGLNGLDEDVMIAALSDSQAEIRESVLQLAERFPASSRVAEAMGQLVNDDSLRVRFQLAFSAGEFPLERRLPWLQEIARRDGDQTMFAVAIQSSLHEGADQFLMSALQGGILKGQLLSRLAAQVAKQSSPEKVLAVLDVVLSIPEEHKATRSELLISLLTNSPKLRQQLSQIENTEVVARMFESARNDLSRNSDPQKRIAAISILRLSPAVEDFGLLLDVLSPNEPASIQLAAIKALATQNSPEVADGILSRWSTMTPTIRKAAEEVLFSRAAWTEVVVQHLENGTLPRNAIPQSRLLSAVEGADNKIQQRVRALCDQQDLSSREQVLKEYSAALTLVGSPQHGKVLFAKHCATCHRLEGVGHEVGPSLTTIKNRGPETIFLNVLDPNREINPEFLNYSVSLVDGRTQTGMIRGESATSLTLLRAEGQSDSLLRNEIEEIRSSGKSLMPEGLEKNFDTQGLADLISYLMSIE